LDEKGGIDRVEGTEVQTIWTEQLIMESPTILEASVLEILTEVAGRKKDEEDRLLQELL